MRYNPATDNARYTIDEIAEQCRNAILKAQQPQHNVVELDSYRIRWEGDLLIAA